MNPKRWQEIERLYHEAPGAGWGRALRIPASGVRSFSINAGLVPSTVTPGSTPPVASRTTPVITLCALAAAGSSRTAI